MISLKKTLIASSAVLAMGISTATLAAYGLPETPEPVSSNNWYVGAFGGVAFTPDTTLNGVKTEYNTAGWDAGAELGYRSGPLRYEVEYIYQRSNIDKQAGVSTTGDVSVHAGMLNVLYDYNDLSSTFTPYIGGGIGYADVKHTGRSSDGEFAFQALVGVGFNVMDNTTLTVGYRYFGTTEAKTALGERFQNHMINAGLIYYID